MLNRCHADVMVIGVQLVFPGSRSETAPVPVRRLTQIEPVYVPTASVTVWAIDALAALAVKVVAELPPSGLATAVVVVTLVLAQAEAVKVLVKVNQFWVDTSLVRRTRIVAVGDRLQNGSATQPIASRDAHTALRVALVPLAERQTLLFLSIARFVTLMLPAVDEALNVPRSTALSYTIRTSLI
jgi:hypothetical protein